LLSDAGGHVAKLGCVEKERVPKERVSSLVSADADTLQAGSMLPSRFQARQLGPNLINSRLHFRLWTRTEREILPV
jgi:hypothetical protein